MANIFAAIAVILGLVLPLAAPQAGQPSPPLRALLQDTPYPVESDTPTPDPYAGPSTETPTLPDPNLLETATESPGEATMTVGPGTPNPTGNPAVTRGPSSTPRPTPTRFRDSFATEDAEIQGARVTPRASETAGPSRTPRPTFTLASSPTATPAPAFIFDRTWFLAGLLIPGVMLFFAWLIYRLKSSGEFKQ